jgi:Uma2 family endonuclease
MVTQARVSVDDVLRLAERDENFELVDGELVPMSPTGVLHGQIEGLVYSVLYSHVEEHQLGLVVVGDVLFRLDVEGRLARAADVAFIRSDRLPGEQTPLGAFIGAPDLAVEIISPGNTANEIQQKIGHWLNHGTQGVLVMYPEYRSVVLWKPDGAIRLQGDDVLDLDPIVPGFRCKVSRLFPRVVGKSPTSPD